MEDEDNSSHNNDSKDDNLEGIAEILPDTSDQSKHDDSDESVDSSPQPVIQQNHPSADRVASSSEDALAKAEAAHHHRKEEKGGHRSGGNFEKAGTTQQTAPVATTAEDFASDLPSKTTTNTPASVAPSVTHVRPVQQQTVRSTNAAQRNISSVLEDDLAKEKYRAMQHQQQQSDALSSEAASRRLSKRTKHAGSHAPGPAVTHVNPGSGRPSLWSKTRQAGAHPHGTNDGKIDGYLNDRKYLLRRSGAPEFDGNTGAFRSSKIGGATSVTADIADEYSNNHDDQASQIDSEASVISPSNYEVVGAVRLHDSDPQGNGYEQVDSMASNNGDSIISPNGQDPVAVEAELVETNNISENERARIEFETRQQMMLEVAQAQMVVVPATSDSGESDQSQSRNKRSIFSKRHYGIPCGYLLAGALLLIIIVVVGALAGSGQFSGSASSSIDNNTDGTTPSPSSVADGSDDSETSKAPVEISNDKVPSQAPSASSMQQNSWQPSLEVTGGPPTNNNECQGAHQIYRGLDNAISASTSSDMEHIVFFMCEAEFPNIDSDIGLWYKYRGENMPVVAEVSAGFSVRVFSINDLTDCNTVACLPDTIYAADKQRVSWIGREGVDYYLAVVTEFYGSGTFELTISGNSARSNAFGPIDLSLFDIAVLGATETGRAIEGVPACGSASMPTSPGVWYSVNGMGSRITASTCGQTVMDTQISVFEEEQTEGTFSNELVCVAGNNDQCRSTQSRVSWNGEVGKVYYILVHGFEDEVGPFFLSVEAVRSIEGIADGDYCTNALDVNDVVYRYGSTNDGLTLRLPYSVDLTLATTDTVEVNMNCVTWPDFVFPYTPIGMWYRVDGTGETFEFIIYEYDSISTDTSVEIDVMRHSRSNSISASTCTDLTCASMDCILGCTWQTTADDVFYIFIHGSDTWDVKFQSFSFYIKAT